MIRLWIKRIFDLLIGIFGLAVFFIPMLVISLLILIKDGRPILFIQARPGKNERIFNLYKFRTMTVDKNQYYAMNTLKNDGDRITKLGQILRKLSLDELTTLFNVLIGDMSIVGPRPLLVHYLELYNKDQKKRHDVKPGITGWAQVNGRNNLSWEKKFELDIWYTKNMTLFLDLKIVILTIFKVIARKDINQTGSATSDPFLGNKK